MLIPLIGAAYMTLTTNRKSAVSPTEKIEAGGRAGSDESGAFLPHWVFVWWGGKRLGGKTSRVIKIVKSIVYPENKRILHDKFSEKIVIAVYRGKRLVGEAFLPIRNVSETESLQFEGKITIFAPREEIKSKAQKVFDYLRPTRGKLQVRVTYTKSAAEELNGLSYRRALIEAIGSPICDLPRNLDNKKAIKKRGEAIKRHKAANIRWGKVKDNFDIPSTKEEVHVFRKSPKKATHTLHFL